VREAYVPSCEAEFARVLGGCAVQTQDWTVSGRVHPDFYLNPLHITNACAQGFGNRFLGGNPCGQTMWLILAVQALALGKKAGIELVAETPDPILDTADFNHIDSTTRHGWTPNRHSSICARIGFYRKTPGAQFANQLNALE
jgi:hypothetical protein